MRIAGWSLLLPVMIASLTLLGLAAVAGWVCYRKHRARMLAIDLEHEARTLRRVDELIRARTESMKPTVAKAGEWRHDRGLTPNLSATPPSIDGSTSPAEPPPTLISVPCLESQSTEDAGEAGEALGRRHAAIWQMADSGLSAEAISSSTGQPIGEIELILGLWRQVRASSAESSKDPRP